jgi:hypothetical protein
VNAEVTLPVPATVDDIDAGWLAAAISFAPEPGRPERIGEAYGLASEVWRIPVGPPIGAVVVKLWDTSTPAGTGEVEFYRRFGDDPGIRVPRCHHGAVDPGRSRGVLVLEDMSDARQGDATTTMDHDDRSRVVRAIAGLHARWWEGAAPEGLPLRIHLPGLGAEPEYIEDRRQGFVERFGPLGDSPMHRVIVDAAQAPSTLLHGDLHLDNILFAGIDGEPCLLDWTRTGTGPGVRSLANLAFNMSPPGTLDEVMATYRDELRRHGVLYDSDTLALHLSAATVRAVLVWTLGMVRWIPATPREAALIELTLDGAASACETWVRRRPSWPRFP